MSADAITDVLALVFDALVFACHPSPTEAHDAPGKTCGQRSNVPDVVTHCPCWSAFRAAARSRGGVGSVRLTASAQ
jgi:hypothetical protein